MNIGGLGGAIERIPVHPDGIAKAETGIVRERRETSNLILTQGEQRKVWQRGERAQIRAPDGPQSPLSSVDVAGVGSPGSSLVAQGAVTPQPTIGTLAVAWTAPLPAVRLKGVPFLKMTFAPLPGSSPDITKMRLEALVMSSATVRTP